MKTNLLVHKHLIVRAESKRPPKDEEHITDWMRDFVESIGMKILMGPFAKYLDISGNRGLTVAAIIETSHIVMHTWDELNPSKIQSMNFCHCFLNQPIFSSVNNNGSPLQLQ